MLCCVEVLRVCLSTAMLYNIPQSTLQHITQYNQSPLTINIISYKGKFPN